MGVVVLPLLLMSYTLGYIFKDSGVPIPGIGYVDIWGFLVNNKPKAAKDLAFENYVIWILFYTIAHFLMYVKPQRSLFHPFKLNPNYPPVSLVFKEILRSLRGGVSRNIAPSYFNQLGADLGAIFREKLGAIFRDHLELYFESFCSFWSSKI